MLIPQKGNICILALTKSNNNNCYNLTGRARTVSPIKHTGLVPVRLGKQKVRPTYVWDRKHRAQRLRDKKTWDHLWYNEIIFTNIPLHLKIVSTTIKDTNGKKKFKRMPSFLFVDKRKLFAMTLSFEDRIGAERLACFEPTRQRGFWRHLRYIPYSVIKENYVFKREFLYFNGFVDGFLHFDIGVKEKPQNMHLKLIFCHVLDRFNWRQRELLFRINLRVFEQKFSRN